MKSQPKWLRRMSWFVFAMFVVSIIFTTVRLIQAPVEIDEAYVNVKSDYALMLVQCILGILAMLLPEFVEHQMKLSIPSGMIVMYVIFLYCAIFLGEVQSFYYQVPHWDTILHIFSGGMLGALGFAFVSFLNRSDHFPLNLTPMFVAIFAFCFAVTLGVFWEVYEFTFDGILGLNMQKFMLEDGTQLVGRFALMDTMKDLMVDCLGAFVVALFGYCSLKYNFGWVKSIQLSRRNKKEVTESEG